MNRPILIITIGYIIGIIWGLYLQTSIVLLYILILAIYVTIHNKYRIQRFKIFSIKRYFRYLKLIFKINIILTIIISSFISNTITKYYNQKYNNTYKEGEIQIEGTIVSNQKQGKYSNQYKLKVKNTYLYINIDKNTELQYGDKVEIKGEFKAPEGAKNYKGFNYKEYLKTLKVYGTINVQQIKIKEISKGNIIITISNKIKENIKKSYNEDTQSLILGILLGDTEQIDAETKEQFSKSNLSHILAVSGIHISYIIFLVTSSSQMILGKRKSKIIASIVLILYMYLTNFSVSVVRAATMGIINCFAFVIYRKSNTINNLAISALIILINNPYSLTSLGFLLTYGGTIGIIVFKNNIEKAIKRIKIKHRKWKYVFIKVQRKCQNIIEILSVSISAQITIMPIIMLKFNTLGITFLITNILLNLVIGIIVMGGLVQILISFISMKIGLAIAKIIEIPIYIVLLISKINIGNFQVITPDTYQVIIYYFIIILINYLYKIFHLKYLTTTQTRIKNIIYVIKYKIRPYRKKIRNSVIMMILILFLISKIPHNLKIHFIDVGQGDSSLIITPHSKSILIDGGGSNTYDVGKNTLLPYLLDRKISKIDFIIISHFDIDHCGRNTNCNRRVRGKKRDNW